MRLQVAELFAGVGGFRLGIEAAGHDVIWSNQWEPAKRRQHASECYTSHFGAEGHVCDDVGTLDTASIPDHDLLVGGFPCQDYSVATTNAAGIEGKKGVLWWHIDRIVEDKRPSYLLLENVDRILKSPTVQRGRDFAILLHRLARHGYRVEWRAINAADYGFPQKRRRTFIFAAHESTEWGMHLADRAGYPTYFARDGFFSQQFPVREEPVIWDAPRDVDVELPASLQATSDRFSAQFWNAGVLVNRLAWTSQVHALPSAVTPLRAILETDVSREYYVKDADTVRWKYLKGSKAEKRVAKNGYEYHYTEGAIPFPDDINQPSRTILTSEGGPSPSRFKHIIEDPATNGLRVLTPTECERLNGFPDGWTATMPQNWRYFCMGNALVVGVVERMASTLTRPVARTSRPTPEGRVS